MIPHKVIICGVVREQEKRVPYSMRIMEKMGEMFEDYEVIIYENNSKDRTPEILHAFGEKNNRFHSCTTTLTDDFLNSVIVNRYEDGKPFVPELIALARNELMRRVHTFSNRDIVIVMDMDFVLEPNYDALKEIFIREDEWDAVFANGIAPNREFWDWYALRDEEFPLGSELMSQEWWSYPRKKVDRYVGNEWQKVYSAFGGCGIYKREAIEGCRYSALVTKDLHDVYFKYIQEHPEHPEVIKYLNQKSNPDILIEWQKSSFVSNDFSVCEHVPFHFSIRNKGFDRMFIVPNFVFRYGGG